MSLSDRFGLWLGFHKCSQDDYLAMIDGYADYFKLTAERQQIHAEALEWATTRGSRSGRGCLAVHPDLCGSSAADALRSIGNEGSPAEGPGFSRAILRRTTYWRNVIGLTATAFCRTSKWSLGRLAPPLMPELAMTGRG